MNVFAICVAIVCYCIALLIAVEKEKAMYHLRNICANATRLLPVLAVVFAIATLLISCGGDPDDHTGENWILLIGLLLCWLKG